MTLRETIEKFRSEGRAIGHFNFSDSNQLKALAEAAKETGLPIIAGLSEGEREYFPMDQARALIDIYRAQGIEMFLNADHTYSVEKVQQAISAGADSVVVDGAKLSLEDNWHMAATCIKYARASGRDIVVEGELGYIGQSSKQLDALPEGVSLENLTTPEDAKTFVELSGVDCLAPSVGNVHGMLKSAAEPRLHPDRVQEIAAAAGVPLVLHGASGNTKEDIQACVKAGITIVHINTEFRVEYRKDLEESLAAQPGEMTSYKLLAPPVEKMKHFIIEKLHLFAGE